MKAEDKLNMSEIHITPKAAKAIVETCDRLLANPVECLVAELRYAKNYEHLMELTFKIPHIAAEGGEDYHRLVRTAADRMTEFTKDRILV